MDPTTVTSFVDLAQKLSGASLAAILIFILIGSYKGVWVWGFQLRKSEEESAQWKAMALQAAGLAETSVNIAKRADK
ncbi:MAG: hypothetical protein ABI665_03755 [Vicinamibacterales bacterium]